MNFLLRMQSFVYCMKNAMHTFWIIKTYNTLGRYIRSNKTTTDRRIKIGRNRAILSWDASE